MSVVKSQEKALACGEFVSCINVVSTATPRRVNSKAVSRFAAAAHSVVGAAVVDSIGDAVGDRVGVPVGKEDDDGVKVGATVVLGLALGTRVADGIMVGVADGDVVGTALIVGLALGRDVEVGNPLGT